MICESCNKEIVGVLMELTLDAVTNKDKRSHKCLNCGNEIDHIAAAKEYTKLHPGENKFLVRIVNKTNVEAK